MDADWYRSKQNEDYHNSSSVHNESSSDNAYQTKTLHAGKHVMLLQMSTWWGATSRTITIGLLFLDNWRGINLWSNKNELSTLEDTYKLNLLAMSAMGQQMV